MDFVFNMVARALDWIALTTGFTYNEINIIAYYILLPFVYVALMDRIFRKHILKILYLAAWTIVLWFVGDFSVFSDALFEYSVRFLLLFSRIGLDYVAASVVVCVGLPAIVLGMLVLLAFPSLRRRFLRRTVT